MKADEHIRPSGRMGMKVEPSELKGEGVSIIPMQEQHSEGLYQAGQEGHVWAYMPMEVNVYADMVRLVREAIQERERGTSVPFVIKDVRSGDIVGSTRFLEISVKDRHIEIGWTWLSPSVWRTRINTECKYLLLKHCFETLQMVRVQLKTDGRNKRSQHAIERLGAVKEGVLRRNRLMYDGHIRDTVYYSILESEWPQVKKRLQQKMNT